MHVQILSGQRLLDIEGLMNQIRELLLLLRMATLQTLSIFILSY